MRVQDALLHAVIQLQQRPNMASPLSGQDALTAVVMYMKQVGTYVDGQAPFIEVAYGCGELAQAAVRACCVYGGAAALERLPEAVLTRERRVCGVRMADGHVIRCSVVVASDVVLAGRALEHTQPRADEGAERVADEHRSTDTSGQAAEADVPATSRDTGPAAAHKVQGGVRGVQYVARATALSDRPVLADSHNIQIVLPPGSCANASTITAWQCGASVNACPQGHILLYLSTPSDGVVPASKLLRGAMETLLAIDRSAASAGQAQCASAASPRGEQAAADTDAAAGGSEATHIEASKAMDSDAEREVARDVPASACVLCFYTQAVYSNVELQLPAGVERCGVPGAECTIDELAAQAESVFARAFPECEFLSVRTDAEVTEGAVKDGHSANDEAEGDELTAALKALGIE